MATPTNRSRSSTTRRGRPSRPRTRTRTDGRTGRKDAIAVLKSDHQTVKRLFERYRGLTDRAMKGKQDVAERLVKELSVHAAVEEQVVYPVIRRIDKTAERMVKHALEEHHEAKELLAELDGMSPTKPQFDALMTTLVEDVTSHIREEEGEVFPRLRKALTRDELVQMGDAVRVMKRVAPTRPHPRSPATPPGNLVVGLVASLVDRVRDAGRQTARRR